MGELITLSWPNRTGWWSSQDAEKALKERDAGWELPVTALLGASGQALSSEPSLGHRRGMFPAPPSAADSSQQNGGCAVSMPCAQ